MNEPRDVEVGVGMIDGVPVTVDRHTSADGQVALSARTSMSDAERAAVLANALREVARHHGYGTDISRFIREAMRQALPKTAQEWGERTDRERLDYVIEHCVWLQESTENDKPIYQCMTQDSDEYFHELSAWHTSKYAAIDDAMQKFPNGHTDASRMS